MRTEYYYKIKNWMQIIAGRKDTIFIGQQVASEDFYGTLKDLPMSKRIEMPVAEELQMGLCLGMSMNGFIPVCIYQRMDFLLRAADQIGNHVAKWERIHKVCPHIIIRTTIGTTKPMDVGPQHSSDYIHAFKHLVDFPVVDLKTPDEVDCWYNHAIENKRPIMLIERTELYDEK